MPEGETLSIQPDDVTRTDDGRLVFYCRCGKAHPLGMWGAAHLGNTVFTTTCDCGRELVFEREDYDADA